MRTWDIGAVVLAAGILLPRVDMTDDQLQDLADYLASLR